MWTWAWRELVFKDQTVFNLWSLHGFNWFNTWKAKAAGYNATETGFNDLQNQNTKDLWQPSWSTSRLSLINTVVKSLAPKMVSVILHPYVLSTCSHFAIQEHVTPTKLALTDLFFCHTSTNHTTTHVSSYENNYDMTQKATSMKQSIFWLCKPRNLVSAGKVNPSPRICISVIVIKAIGSTVWIISSSDNHLRQYSKYLKSFTTGSLVLR